MRTRTKKKGGRGPRVESGCRRERRVERGRRLAEHVLATERDPRRRKRPMPSVRDFHPSRYVPPHQSPVNLLRASSRFVGSFRVNASPSAFGSSRHPLRCASRRAAPCLATARFDHTVLKEDRPPEKDRHRVREERRREKKKANRGRFRA